MIELTSPPYYPPYNGKMERSVRDLKSYVRAMKRKHSPLALSGRIAAAIHDLNEQRPRPVLGGKTAREVFADQVLPLPDRRKFQREIERRERWLASAACSRKEQDDARRRAVAEVLLEHGLMAETRGRPHGSCLETVAS